MRSEHQCKGGTRRRFLNLLIAFGLLATAWPPAAAATTAVADCRIAVLGDSLTAGYGVDLADAFPVRLQAALAAEAVACEVLNAGVSGDTTAGGLARLDWVLGDDPTHLLIELGGNDALRAIPVEAVEANLAAIIEGARARGVEVMLAGMLAPPNLGPRYTDAFAAVFPRLAERHGVPLYPFFLDGAIQDPTMMAADGIHPNPAGVVVIVERILPYVVAWLDATG